METGQGEAQENLLSSRKASKLSYKTKDASAKLDGTASLSFGLEWGVVGSDGLAEQVLVSASEVLI